VAARTKTLLLGTGVVALPLWNARRLAKAALSVEAISNGRLILGVGLGFSPQDCYFVKVDWHLRRKIADETLEDVRRLTSMTQPGEKNRIDKPNRAMLEWISAKKRRIPIWVAAKWNEGYADGALRRTALYGDCFFPSQPELADYAAAQRKIRECALSEARNPDEMQWACMIAFCLGENKETAKTMLEAHPFAPHLHSRLAALGRPEDLIEYIEKFVELGVSHFVFMPSCDPNQTVEQFRVIAETVVPYFRTRVEE
jgi:alkanesulfonate monooxygenase SsuD/methylene tetrahydromethanopterin reductase-like flavin-dependent oxidoreductase (luciferase family)